MFNSWHDVEAIPLMKKETCNCNDGPALRCDLSKGSAKDGLLAFLPNMFMDGLIDLLLSEQI